MNVHEKINYIEFPANDFVATKLFFTEVFAWSFVDYGEDYVAFSNAGLEGGFYRSGLTASSQAGGALLVFYSQALEQTQAKIVKAGGEIIIEIFDFPGGQRFHFLDPNGNEYAVWSDKNT